MKNKSLILSFIILFLASAVFLAYRENKLSSSESQNWWAAYFPDAKGNSLDFAIENNSNETNFHWALLDGNKKIAESDIQIKKGETKKINFGNTEISNSQNQKKEITITAKNGESKKIYKIF